MSSTSPSGTVEGRAAARKQEDGSMALITQPEREQIDEATGARLAPDEQVRDDSSGHGPAAP
jgi:hypothetical protein